MHTECFEFVELCEMFISMISGANSHNLTILEIGSKDLNGSVRGLFADPGDLGTRYVGIDLNPGPGVDIVADGKTFGKDEFFDIVICLSVFEHCPGWQQIVKNAARVLKPNGFFICTTVNENYPIHSGIEAVPYLINDEYYEQITYEKFCDAFNAVQEFRWSYSSMQNNASGDLFVFAQKMVFNNGN